VGGWLSLVIAVAGVAAWEWGARAGAVDALLFPEPSFIAETMGRLVGDGSLISDFLATLRRMAWGVLIGGGAGLLLGLAMGRWRPLRSVVDPFVAATHPLPKIALLPLIMVVLGIGDASRVAIIAGGAFFPLLINTMSGVDQINSIHYDVAHNYRAGPLKVFRRVVLPGASPSIVAGMRLALNTALLLTIAVEMISARDGLGGMVWMAWTTLRVEEIYVAVLVTVLLGLAINGLLALLSQLLLPWQVGRAR
jgi:NitT/TauT family transport system permease protein